jgi:hypothetical protein
MVVLGNVLQKVFKLRNKLYQYLRKENRGSAYMFNNSDFIMKLAYLSKTFEKLNIINTSLQSSNNNILQFSDKLKSFIKS